VLVRCRGVVGGGGVGLVSRYFTTPGFTEYIQFSQAPGPGKIFLPLSESAELDNATSNGVQLPSVGIVNSEFN
jgi:hypothetical protein